MSADPIVARQRSLSILKGQGAFAIMGWTMASPTIVLTFLAVTLDLPIFLAGALVAILHTAGTITDVFLAGPISRKKNKRQAMALADIAVAACFMFAISVAFFGTKEMITVAFIVTIFTIGAIREIKSLMITDFLGDNLQSKNRMRIHYTQMALGGAGAIALTWFAHIIMVDNPPLARHSVVIAIAITCFFLSALSMLALGGLDKNSGSGLDATHSPGRSFKDFIANVRQMLARSWFQKYMIVRLSFVFVGLSVPFFALIAAEAHHTSAKGLTVLIVSSAAGMMVAAPLWRALNGFSNRVVMVTGAMLVVTIGSVLVASIFRESNMEFTFMQPRSLWQRSLYPG